MNFRVLKNMTASAALSGVMIFSSVCGVSATSDMRPVHQNTVESYKLEDAFKGVSNTQSVKPLLGAYHKSEALKIEKPKHGSTWYVGETVPVSISAADRWTNYYTLPTVALYSGEKFIKGKYASETVDKKAWNVYSWNLDLKDIPAGKYSLVSISYAVKKKNGALKDAMDYEAGDPYAENDITVKELRAPDIKSAKRTGKKVKINLKKVSAADKYNIYRSDSKTGKFTKIGDTESLSYTDKSAGKSVHYYKVKSVRKKHGTVKSSYSVIIKR